MNTRLPATVGRTDLLPDGSDADFRRLLHGLMSYGRMIDEIRAGFGTLLGVSGIQYEILMAIQRLEGETGVAVSDVAAWIRRSGTFVTNEVRSLMHRRLVEKGKDAADGRKVLLGLTNDARTRIAALSPTQIEVNDLLFEAISEVEFREFGEIVARLLPCGERATIRMDAIVRERLVAEP
ncbi:MarR family winged helix-turn-helix transcriptional regulator [Nitratireductor sp. ZSWI3]|uniref:MarR family winged helix-turn-helix transcriptional regulator n=1 Tax=Nitratireductor sp. ZSWI3 TaxID=2966359 RepID=UPI0021502419|nr:MarR family winged helix-turn-helix transcriptional regulator [Nitratireductor sp. ZSWI3]MCR4266639.1 MarR family winged helix-turn-helix transcriptional regulator [Nitratireductor sp. ZSWI3]